jgi:hypothetical protein
MDRSAVWTMTVVATACALFPATGGGSNPATTPFYWFLVPAGLSGLAGLFLQVPHWRACRMAARLLTASGLATLAIFLFNGRLGGWPTGLAGPTMFFLPVWAWVKAGTDLKDAWQAARDGSP